jgi:hypothetical protein
VGLIEIGIGKMAAAAAATKRKCCRKWLVIVFNKIKNNVKASFHKYF